jgi:hypothetical protein
MKQIKSTELPDTLHAELAALLAAMKAKYGDYWANPVDGWWCGQPPHRSGGARSEQQNLPWRRYSDKEHSR